MQLIETATELARLLDEERSAGRAVGLVPTMGALHAGHASLIARSRRERDLTVVSVFVNPLQFGTNEDLDRYPRDIQGDLVTAAGAGADYVFAPAVTELYPAPVLTTVHVAGLTEGLEGASRPGHFDGVATVLARLFGIVGRCSAYFGEKDYQQLAVVTQMVRELRLPIAVVGCPTVREPDGLALSSRNRLLPGEVRAAAPVLYWALSAGAGAIAGGERDVVAVRKAMAAVVEAERLASLDYLEVADPVTLEVPDEITAPVRLLGALRLGGVRLIDNLAASPAG